MIVLCFDNNYSKKYENTIKISSNEQAYTSANYLKALNFQPKIEGPHLKSHLSRARTIMIDREISN